MHLPDKLLLLPYMFQPHHIHLPKHDKLYLRQLTHLKGRLLQLLYSFLEDHMALLMIYTK